MKERIKGIATILIAIAVCFGVYYLITNQESAADIAWRIWGFLLFIYWAADQEWIPLWMQGGSKKDVDKEEL